jgi:DNA repair exonuclease SbcCD ATPase subunit
MTNQGYRIQRLAAANFRGITEQRTIDVSGRHLFLLGPNSFGKSTIVEAIRWCLFGSPSGQQEIEVRNTFCPAETSDVVLDLAAQHRTLTIHRSLPPGRTESRAIITDHDGRNLLVRDAFPQLARLGQPTGTQVIFAAQHAAGRRQAEISDFSRVLYFYLAVEEIPDLLEKLRKLAEERRAQREEMSKSLDGFLQELRSELSGLQGKKDEILKNPPWGKGQIPTRSETDRKIDDLLHGAGRLTEAEAPPGLSRQDKIGRIKEWNAALASSKNEALRAKLADLEVKREKAQKATDEWHTLASGITKAEEKIAELENRERALLGAQPLDGLADQLAAAEQEHGEAVLRSAIRRHAAIYLDKYHPSQCPVCNQALATGTFEPQGEDPAADGSAARCDELRKRISDIKQLREERSTYRKSVASSRDRVATISRDAETLIGTSSPAPDALEHYIQNLDDVILSARNQIKDAQAEHERRDRRTRDLEAEERFHNYQEKVAAIETILEKDISGSRSALTEYDSFLSTAEDIGKLVLEAFETQISFAISPLAEEITRVYARLTAHPSYDGILIVKQPSSSDRMEPGKLELQVTSSRCPGKCFPANVLNGQAARALQLVPYFVFSDYWHDVMELDLLLVDDPSESFDTSHLDHLMCVLQSVASHTQLVVASHETERMRPLIDKYFRIEERCIVSVEDFDPLKGPTLEQQ